MLAQEKSTNSGRLIEQSEIESAAEPKTFAVLTNFRLFVAIDEELIWIKMSHPFGIQSDFGVRL